MKFYRGMEVEFLQKLPDRWLRKIGIVVGYVEYPDTEGGLIAMPKVTISFRSETYAFNFDKRDYNKNTGYLHIHDNIKIRPNFLGIFKLLGT